MDSFSILGRLSHLVGRRQATRRPGTLFVRQKRIYIYTISPAFGDRLIRLQRGKLVTILGSFARNAKCTTTRNLRLIMRCVVIVAAVQNH